MSRASAVSRSGAQSNSCAWRRGTREVTYACPSSGLLDWVRALASHGDRVTRNEVLIIGAGPSGLFAAAELARHGVWAEIRFACTRRAAGAGAVLLRLSPELRELAHR
jgi:NADPH-dependent glutamate synthase beta subunit-like oxidoreductase